MQLKQESRTRRRSLSMPKLPTTSYLPGHANHESPTKANETQAAAVAAAVAQAKSEKHADELQALQDSLTAKHAAELKAAADAARAENPGSSLPANVDALISAAIAQHDKDQEKARQDEITAAVERGRAEAATRAKLKDQQLVKTQKKVKDLEAQILAWQNQGVLPTPYTHDPIASTSASAASAPPTTAPASTSTPDSTPAATKPTAAARGGAPVAAAARGGAPGATRGAPAARGAATRARGNGLSIRGGATRVPPPAAATATPTSAPAAGVSIMGAAKRPREEGSAEDSLAKRLKPAEPANSKPPVQLRRPPPS
ncbi:hypothetical protein B0H13DRAFT_2559377 [Mycena leptocephala]|nr:hypothetical protein B0H13DRAFT_2559377 [Mycena leptocephala]